MRQGQDCIWYTHLDGRALRQIQQQGMEAEIKRVTTVGISGLVKINDNIIASKVDGSKVNKSFVKMGNFHHWLNENITFLLFYWAGSLGMSGIALKTVATIRGHSVKTLVKTGWSNTVYFKSWQISITDLIKTSHFYHSARLNTLYCRLMLSKHTSVLKKTLQKL